MTHNLHVRMRTTARAHWLLRTAPPRCTPLSSQRIASLHDETQRHSSHQPASVANRVPHPTPETEDLTHLFDAQGIDENLYEADVRFEDPLTKYDNISGYLFNITMLKNVFKPSFVMHSIEQTVGFSLHSMYDNEADPRPLHPASPLVAYP
jgi:hypothetical protein